jgi:hypothetical protein
LIGGGGVAREPDPASGSSKWTNTAPLSPTFAATEGRGSTVRSDERRGGVERRQKRS